MRLLRSAKDSLFAVIYSFLLSFFTMTGIIMNRNAGQLDFSMKPWQCICVILLIILFTLSGAELYLIFRDLILLKSSKAAPETSPHDIKRYFVYLCTLMLMWLPVLLAYYPGIFSYDVYPQLTQSIGTYSTHHPLLHTLILQFFYNIVGGRLFGSYNIGMLCYTLLQMLLFSMSIAYMHLFLYRMKISRILRIALLIFTGIFPIYSMFSISMTKDIPFASSFLTLFICLCYCELMPEIFKKRRMEVLFVFSVLGTVLFRNNGIYCIVLAAIAGFIFLREEKRKRILILSVAGIVISLSLQGLLKYGTQASNGSINEMLSIPYQQLSRVYNLRQDELSQSDKEIIEELIPNAWNYNVYLADMTKDTGRIYNNKRLFVSIYPRLLIKYPSSFISAFLNNTMGYWYLFDTTNAEIYGSEPGKRLGFLLSDTKPGLGVKHISYFPKLENLYEHLFSLNEYQNIPPLFILCSIALYIWLAILCVFYAINLKRKQAVMPIIFLMSYIITIFAGPCALIRYAFPIIGCIPPLFIVIFRDAEK